MGRPVEIQSPDGRKINTSPLLHTLIVLLCLSGLTACSDKNDTSPVNSKDKKPPNILIIYTDDLDFDEIATYLNHRDSSLHQPPSHTAAAKKGLYHTNKPGYTLGYESVGPMVTPNIDRLAREGMTFSRFYVTSPVCTPSRFSLMTGRYASRSQHLKEITPSGEPLIIAFNTPLDGETTLPKLLQQRGYITGLAGKWHNFGDADSSRGNGQIAELEDADPQDPQVAKALRQGYENRVQLLKEEAGFDFIGALYPGNVEEIGIPKKLYSEMRHNLEWITATAVQFIDRYHKEPFFLYVAPTTPHGWMGDIGSDEDKLYTPAGIMDAPPQSGMPSRADVYRRIAAAGSGRAMATWLDDSVGAILDKLQQRGIAGNTLVIFTSDHGNRGKESVYEAARVPFIVRWPGHVKAGSVSHALIGNIDIAPTVMNITGSLSSDGHLFDGISFRPVIEGEAATVRDSLMLEMSSSRALVTEQWKYIANRPPEEIAARMADEASSLDREERRYGWDGNWNRTRGGSGDWREPPRINYRNHMFFPAYFELDQLYNLQTDPFEQHNLAADPAFADILQTLKVQLGDDLEKTGQYFGEFPRPQDPSP